MAATRRIGILTGGGDVPGPERGHQERRLPLDRARLRGPRHPARLGGPHPPPPGPGARHRVRPAARSGQHADDRPDRRDVAPHVADEPAQDAGRPTLPDWLDRDAARRDGGRRRRLRPHPGRPREHRAPRDRRPRDDRRRRHAELLARPSSSRASRSSRSRRRWTTTSRAPSTASASRRRSRGRRRRSTASGRRSARTSGSASSGSSAATPASRRSTPRTSRRPAASSRRRPYDLDRLATILAEDHRNNPSRYALVITAEGAIWQGARMQDVGDADMFGHRHKANVGEALAAELKAADRDRDGRVGADLRPPERRAGLARLDGRDRRSRTSRWTSSATASPAGWSRSRTASTPTRRCRRRASGRAGSTSPRCTTSSGSGRATRASSATRCCSSGLPVRRSAPG